MLRKLVTLAGLVGFILSMPPRPAYACGDCVCQPPGVVLDIVPRDTDVLPLNPRIFAILSPTDEVTWARVSDGAGVPVTLTAEDGLPGATWITPLAPLDAGTQYRLTVGSDREITYTTGQAADTTAPTAVVASVSTPSVTDSCTAVRGAVLYIEKLVDDTGGAMMAVLDVTGPNHAERVFFEPHTGVSNDAPYAAVFGAVTGGDPSCIPARTLADARLGETYTAKLTVFDAAGNATSIDRRRPNDALCR